ncbi:MAG: lysophospholipase [Clostridiales Family XIII bacterium]|nr:lysophospholipase [Clostridiales Family XIII bacterium]
MGLIFSVLELKSYKPGLSGYSWRAEDPKAVVCLLHGTGEHARKYRTLAEWFAEKHISTYAIDLRGHGASEGQRGHIGARHGVFEDVDSLIDTARSENNDIPIIVFGHSLGGNIALHYRLCGKRSAEPSAYIVSSPWLKLRAGIPKSIYLLAKSAAKFKPDARLHALAGMRPPKKYRLFDECETEKLTHSWMTLQTAVDGYEAADSLLAHRFSGYHAGGNKPLVILQGTGDLICSPDGAREFAEAEGELCTLLEYPDYFHEVYNGSKNKSGADVVRKMCDIILSYASHKQS